jgi:autotransporter-associated beta strand protein
VAAAVPVLAPTLLRAGTVATIKSISDFEGEEEPTVIYSPDTATFANDSYDNMIDEGGGMTRVTLRNNYPTLGWWDGDRNTTNDDRQRGEWKGFDALAHQHANQTFEYSFDFRTNPGFSGTSHFCHIFQLKQTENGSSGFPLVTVSLYKNGSVTEGRVIDGSENLSGSSTARTFSFTANTWNHVVVRVTTTNGTAGDTSGALVASVNGDAFSGLTNVQMWSDDGAGAPSNDYRTKFGFYRGIGTTYGVPAGDSWVEHRTITGYDATSNVLTWKGGLAGNAWDTATTANFLNGASASVFNTIDQVNFDNSSANTTVNIGGSVAPGYMRVNSSQNYTFSGVGSITAGTMRKDGTGTLTLATTNTYAGLTDVRAGTLLVTGSIGNNSLASVTGGTLKAGSAAALGTNSTIGTQINGGTLDINGFNLSTEPIAVQGAGVSSAGAIVNTGAQQTSALTNVTLTGDTTFGGSGRWDVRGTGAQLSTGGSAYNLTKTGTNQISFVGANVDAGLGNITINQGILAFQTSTSSLGDASKSVTINAGATLGFYNSTGALSKLATLNGGAIWAESGTGTQNNFLGAVTLGAAGGTLYAGGALTGGSANAAAVLKITGNITGSGALTKNGPGVVTLAGSNSYSGGTMVNAGTLVLDRSFTSTTTVSVATGATMQLAQSATTPNNVVLKAPSCSIAGSGKLDLKDNKLIVTSTPTGSWNGSAYTGVTGLIARGYNGGDFLGGGVVTTMSGATGGNSLTSIGVASNNALGLSTFGGTSVAASDTLVMYTYAGDANLDGAITGDDYFQIDSGFPVNAKGWFNGDFNYDGTINGDDYFIIDSNFPQQGAPLVELAPVPEPAAISVAGVAVTSLLGGRRRRQT